MEIFEFLYLFTIKFQVSIPVSREIDNSPLVFCLPFPGHSCSCLLLYRGILSWFDLLLVRMLRRLKEKVMRRPRNSASESGTAARAR